MERRLVSPVFCAWTLDPRLDPPRVAILHAASNTMGLFLGERRIPAAALGFENRVAFGPNDMRLLPVRFVGEV